MRRWFRVDPLHLRVGMVTSAVVIGALGTGFVVSWKFHDARMAELVRRHAAIQGSVIVAGLEHSMLRDDEELIAEMVSQYAVGAGIERVSVLDRLGEVRYSNDPSWIGTRLDLDGPTCQVCHATEPEARVDSIEVDVEGTRVLRNVQPLHNREACHECHDPRDRINGVLLVDVPTESAYEGLDRTMGPLAVGAGAMTMFVLGSIALLFRREVLHRLYQFREVAAAIGGGELDRRLEEAGDDAITDIERHFNRMADSIVGLLGEVEEQRNNLEHIMNTVDDGLIVVDQAHRIVAANDAFVGAYGSPMIGLYCCDESGTPSAGLCQREGHPPGCLSARCLSEGEAFVALRRTSLPDGRELYHEIRTSPSRAGEVGAGFVVQLWRDISDRRGVEARLADTQRMASLGMLASGFSHEINTPLSSIGACLEGIARILDSESGDGGRDGPGDGSLAAEYAHIALSEVQRCGAITRQFLQLARGRTIEESLFDLFEVVERVAHLVSPTARQRGVPIEVERAPEGDRTVQANERAVEQVLLNLILNAVEISDAHSPVTLCIADRGDALAVVVSDRGGGISPDDIDRVFEPFFSRRSGGTGLGLFVSLEMAHAWGGDIDVVNTPGVGASFAVTFPKPTLDHGS